jgi:transposase-like protein
MRNYTDEYRDQAVQKLLRPGGPSVRELSEETGVHVATLYKWLREKKNGHMSRKFTTPRKWTLRRKLAALLEARGKSEDELGRWLREQGLHADHLERFAKEIESALEGVEMPDRAMELENRELRKELNLKDKTIAEMSALLVLKKNYRMLLND